MRKKSHIWFTLFHSQHDSKCCPFCVACGLLRTISFVFVVIFACVGLVCAEVSHCLSVGHSDFRAVRNHTNLRLLGRFPACPSVTLSDRVWSVVARKERRRAVYRVARSPVFYGRSRISDLFFRLPEEAAGKNKSPVFC